MKCCACGSDTDKMTECGGFVCGKCVSKLKEAAPSASNNSAMAKLLERWLYPEKRGDIMELTHDTKVAIEQLRQ